MNKIKYLALSLSLVACQKQIGTGRAGADGVACEVTQLANGALIQCANSSALITNGVDGLAGSDGQPGTPGTNAVLEIINPCGTNGSFDEILLRLNDGTIIALLDGGPHLDRLIVLPSGNYTTSDGMSCNFIVTENGEII